ncbi:DUF4242 domain-containing protein [Candidatus Marinarcus aquaticus]|nr:DUF4242 domain-containing protein [Candidatus Marinarcus aquaticus]
MNHDNSTNEIMDDELNRREFIKKAGIVAGIVALSSPLTPLTLNASKIKKNLVEGKMKFFIDTHDKNTQTFPADITPKQMESFYQKYEAACAQEGVISLRIHVGFEDGKAFCFNMAPNVEAVKRVHDKVGLPYESITEVNTITPADLALLN